MKIVYIPEGSTDNAYTSIIKESLEQNGCEVITINEFLSRKNKETVPVILNWFDEVKSRNCILTYFKYVKRKMRLLQFRLKGARIVYVIHNRKPHDVFNKSDLFFSQKLRMRLCKVSSSVVVLCDETRKVLMEQLGHGTYSKIESKIFKVPIPTYTGYYDKSGRKWREEFKIDPDNFLFVFTGLIRKYKGIQLIIDVAKYFQDKNYDADFIVAGKCVPKCYQESIEEMASGIKNLHLSFGFVDDGDLAELSSTADAFLLPLNQKSSLNSSTVYLAFSFGKNVVCPNIGTIKEFDPNLVYSYDYENVDEHRENIIRTAEHAYLDRKSSKDGFNSVGARLKQIVDDQNSVENVGAKFREAIEFAAGLDVNKGLVNEK